MNLLLMSEIQRKKKYQKFGTPKKDIQTTPYEPIVDSKFLKQSKKAEKRSKREEELDDKIIALQLAFNIADANGIPPPTGRGLKSEMVSLNKHKIFVEEENVGSIIGPNGNRIKALRKYSNCKIYCCQPLEGEHKRTIELTGEMKQIQMATYLINCCYDLYGNNEHNGMNYPFARTSTGEYRSQIGDWLTTTNQTPEEQMVIKSFFMSYEQKQKFEQEQKLEAEKYQNKFVKGMEGYKANQKLLNKDAKGFQNKFKRRKTKTETETSGMNHPLETLGDNGLQMEDYLEKVPKKKSKKSKKSRNEDYKVDKRSNKQILEDLQREYMLGDAEDQIFNPEAAYRQDVLS